jgi:hypothetical protein
MPRLQDIIDRNETGSVRIGGRELEVHRVPMQAMHAITHQLPEPKPTRDRRVPGTMNKTEPDVDHPDHQLAVSYNLTLRYAVKIGIALAHELDGEEPGPWTPKRSTAWVTRFAEEVSGFVDQDETVLIEGELKRIALGLPAIDNLGDAKTPGNSSAPDRQEAAGATGSGS